MWESPINIMEIQEPIIEQFNKEREEMVLNQIWKIGIDVNKEELMKALKYDRGQYEKGYAEGYEKAIDDFAEKLHDLCGYEEDGIQYPYVLHESRIDEIAEQLKAGDTDGNERTNN